MKKIKLFILITLLFTLTGCNFFKQLSCKHEWTEEVITVATCEEDGEILKKCTKCNVTKSVKVKALNHDYVETSKVEATCETNGSITKTCKNCHNEIVDVIKAIGHNYVYNIKQVATCTNSGIKEGVCSNCNNTISEEIPALGHNFSSFEIVTPSTTSKTGLKQRTCKNCNLVEDVIIPIIDYIDYDVINYDLKKEEIVVTSEEELTTLYSAAILNRCASIEATLDFDYDSFEELFKRVKENQSINSTFEAHISLSGDELSIKFDYPSLPSKVTTSENRYTQYASFNASNNAKVRSEDFDNFKINQSELSYEVSTSDQLFYVLERGVKPICTSGSIAEKIYNKAKEVLRLIINDEMNDYEKTKAIHDWIILNVTYDNALYDLVFTSNSDLKLYNGFYLEGVFIDGYAVCEGISKAFVVLANIEGIPCVQVTGTSGLSTSSVGHAWNKINVEGTWYIVDATSDGTIISSSFEILSYEYFLISDKTMKESQNQYIGDNFTNIECNSDYEMYSNFKYNETNLFSVSSFEELKTLVKAFNEMNEVNKTVQIKMNYSVSGSLVDEVNKAYNVLKIASTFSYIENGNVITIIMKGN